MFSGHTGRKWNSTLFQAFTATRSVSSINDRQIWLSSAIPSLNQNITYLPLFEYDIVALLSNSHPLNRESFLTPHHFKGQTLITYPVADDMLDIMQQVLIPAKISPERRTSELTIAILQLVASGRGIAALPLWAIKNYLDRNYISSRPVTEKGLKGKLYAAVCTEMSSKAYINDFVKLIREKSLVELPGVRLLG